MYDIVEISLNAIYGRLRNSDCKEENGKDGQYEFVHRLSLLNCEIILL